MMDNYISLLENRKSVRSFQDRPVSNEIVQKIIHTSMRAPTAGNMMLYSIIEISDQSVKDKLAVSCDNQPFIATAPLVLLYAADYQRTYDYFIHSKVDRYCKRTNRVFRKPELGDMMLAVDDALIAAQTAVTAVEILGLGSCYIGDIMENYVYHRELLEMPDYVFPAALLCIGYATEQAKKRSITSRFDSEYIHFKNTYRKLSSEEFEKMYKQEEEIYRGRTSLPYDAENNGQYLYTRKFASGYASEMNRSVKQAMKIWDSSV